MSDCVPVIAVPPGGAWVAIACGTSIHIFRSGDGNEDPLTLSSSQKIQALCVSSDQLRLLSSGDDKAVNIWSTENWKLAHSSTAGKKVASGCFTPDSKYAIIGDKFGDVSIMPVQAECAELAPLLGHYCATITTLAVAASGKAIVSGDRDGKLRVSILPEGPMKGSWEIMSYCLLHTASITCSAFCHVAQEEVLVSGALDGHIIAWDHTTGKELCTMPSSDRSTATDAAHVTAGVVALAAHGDFIAAAVEGEAAVLIAQCSRGTSGSVELQEVARVPAAGVALPCRLQWSAPDEFWVAGCASADNKAAVAANSIHRSGEGIWQSRQDSAISAAVSKHLAKLEGINVVQYQSLLQKRDYPLEEREERKGRGKKRPQPDNAASVGDVSQS